MIENVLFRGFAFLFLAGAAGLSAQRPTPGDTEHVRHVRIESERLTAFWGRAMHVEAGVVLPPEHREEERLPVAYWIHGFGGSHRVAWRVGPRYVEQMREGELPRMILVFLNAQFPMGHHVFADSVNNGPWGTALVEEFVPAVEGRFGAFGGPAGRFLTGHSSGGWSSLWLQVRWPGFFNGTWSTAPDPVDFRDFTGIDIYGFENAFVDPEGEPIPLVRRGERWVMTIEEFVQREFGRREYGGQFYSFNAVFSPRGEDGTPMRLFDVGTGEIDGFVAEKWKRYDISLVLEERWEELGPELEGKLHVFMGTRDTFRLEGALYLMRERLRGLGSDAEIVFVEGRDHGSLLRAHERWPDGLRVYVLREMFERFRATR